MTPSMDKILTARVEQILAEPKFATYHSRQLFENFGPEALDLAPEELKIFVTEYYQNEELELKALIKLCKLCVQRAFEREGIDPSFGNRDLENCGVRP